MTRNKITTHRFVIWQVHFAQILVLPFYDRVRANITSSALIAAGACPDPNGDRRSWISHELVSTEIRKDLRGRRFSRTSATWAGYRWCRSISASYLFSIIQDPISVWRTRSLEVLNVASNMWAHCQPFLYCHDKNVPFLLRDVMWNRSGHDFESRFSVTAACWLCL
jgi:hypothetical protein